MDSLKLIRRHLQEDAGYLDHPDCPYSPELVEFLKEILPERKNPLEQIDRAEEEAHEEAEELPEEVDIETESRRLYHEMRGFLRALDKTEVSDRAAMFRTCTALLEKLITIQERAQGVNQYMGFKRLLFEALDEYLTPSQRTELLERLEKEL